MFQTHAPYGGNHSVINPIEQAGKLTLHGKHKALQGQRNKSGIVHPTSEILPLPT